MVTNMADNTCPLCGKKLRNGYCPDCGGGMTDSYEDRADTAGYGSSGSVGGYVRTRTRTSSTPYQYGNPNGAYNIPPTENIPYENSGYSNAQKEVEAFKNMGGSSSTVFYGNADNTSVMKLIFTRRHIWKFILTLLWPIAGVIVGIITAKASDGEARRVGKVLLGFSIVMMFIMPILGVLMSFFLAVLQ